MIAGRLLRRFQQKYFPTEQDRILCDWWNHHGDSTLRVNYDLTPQSLVMDLGGYQGQWTSDIFSRYLCKVKVFEPVKSFADGIGARFRHNDNIIVYPYGLGGFTRKEWISLCAEASSIAVQSGEREEIEIVDVADWFSDEKIKSVDLMKINIEGAEYELLERLLDTGLVNMIRNIQVQFHNVNKDSEDRMEAVQERLLETHTLTYQYRFVWENWTRQ